jgi:hypothetical protein
MKTPIPLTLDNMIKGQIIKINEQLVHDSSLASGMQSHISAEKCGWQGIGYATIESVDKTHVYVRTLNKQLVFLEISKVMELWELYVPRDFRGNVIKIGDKCAFADSGKNIVIGTCQKLGKLIHKGCGWCEVQVIFGDLEHTTYDWLKSPKHVRIQNLMVGCFYDHCLYFNRNYISLRYRSFI